MTFVFLDKTSELLKEIGEKSLVFDENHRYFLEVIADDETFNKSFDILKKPPLFVGELNVTDEKILYYIMEDDGKYHLIKFYRQWDYDPYDGETYDEFFDIETGTLEELWNKVSHIFWKRY